MEDRREALKIIGAIGTTCAFPFASDELYGQHVHPAPGAQVPAGPPKFFDAPQFALVSRIADLIIPNTRTPGAVAAGVPSYIDEVVFTNTQHQRVFREGLALLTQQAKEQHGKPFLELTEAQQIALLTPLSEAVDRDNLNGTGPLFFRAMKSMTADGYYTSRIGLLQEIGYSGNTVLSEYPACELPEH